MWARDEGISGSNGLDTRRGLFDALEAIRRGQVGGLVVYRLDRLARDLVIQEQLLADVWRLGGEVHSTSQGEAGVLTDDPNDPSRQLIRQVLGAVAQYERAMIRLRMRSGRERKAEKGGYAGFGSPAFGQRAAGGELVSDDNEQAVITRIRELRREKDEHGKPLSLRGIAQRLTEDGIKPKRGGDWHPQSLARIIARLG